MPVYNEGENIQPALTALYETVTARPLEVLVVYDFDEDTTVPVVERLAPRFPGLRPFRNRIGRGVVNAIKAGLAEARSDHVLVTMADLSDDPRSIDSMLDLASGGADVVAGSRYMRGGHQVGGPLVKRTLSRLAGLSLHWIGGVPTHDATNSFKIYSRRLLDKVTVESNGGFEVGLELTVKAYRSGMRIAEVPTTWRDRTAGQSRFQMRKWIPRYLHWYWIGMAGRFSRSGPAEGTTAGT